MAQNSFTPPLSNTALLVRYFYEHPGDSRAQAARHFGLTPAAVTIITSRLLTAGILVEEHGESHAKNGRSVGLRVNTSAFKTIGVKFARSRIEIAVFDFSGTQLSGELLPPATNENAHHSIATVRERVRELLHADDTIAGIGIAVPGPYLRDVGHIVVMTSMPTWQSINFREEFETAFGPIPVTIEQDARAGALAQSLFDRTSDSSSLSYLLLGEGVGLGVIENGHVLNGALGTSTEIGHISIDVSGPRCECGNRGCLELYCSSIAIHRDLIENHSELIKNAQYLSHDAAVTAVCKLSASGNPEAQDILHRVGTLVGYGCVTIINAYNPRSIIIGDLLSAAGNHLLDPIQRVIQDRLPPQLADSCSVRFSHLHSDSTLLGAAGLAINTALSHPDLLAK